MTPTGETGAAGPRPARWEAHGARHRRQRGAALLTAMVIVTLVATLAAAMVWQQWRSVQVEAAERAQAQSQWVLRGALDWAMLLLREDARNNQSVDHLGEPWAMPLAESRLSTFLAADRDNSSDAPEAFLSGVMHDLQGRYNLFNLVTGAGGGSPGGAPTGTGAAPAAQATELATLTTLCSLVGVSADVPARIADLMTRAQPAATGNQTPPQNVPLMPQSVDQLRWLGIDANALARLAPYVTVLPSYTPVNLNTASREVLAAVLGVTLADAERLLQIRQRSPFDSTSAAQAALPGAINKAGGRVGVNTNYFEVTGVLRLESLVVSQRSVIERRSMQQIKVLSTQRIRRPDELAKPLQQ